MRYSKWDEVVLKIDDNFGYRDTIFVRLKVMIIGCDVNNNSDSAQYLCYVPPYEHVPCKFPTFTINRHHAKYFEFEQKFIGDTGCFITTKMKIFKHIPAVSGEKCDHCKDWFDGAVRDDDGIYTCRACRENPWR